MKIKEERFSLLAVSILSISLPVIREVAGFIGMTVAYAPVVEYSGVHLKMLVRDKIKALEKSKDDFERITWVSGGRMADIKWWLDHLECPRKTRRKEPDVELFTDASHLDRGAHMNEKQTGSIWH